MGIGEAAHRSGTSSVDSQDVTSDTLMGENRMVVCGWDNRLCILLSQVSSDAFVAQ